MIVVIEAGLEVAANPLTERSRVFAPVETRVYGAE